MTDVKDTRTLTLEGALKALNAAIAEATRIGQPNPCAAPRAENHRRNLGPHRRHVAAPPRSRIKCYR